MLIFMRVAERILLDDFRGSVRLRTRREIDRFYILLIYILLQEGLFHLYSGGKTKIFLGRGIIL